MDSSIKPLSTVSTMAPPQTRDGSAYSPVTVDPSPKNLVLKDDDKFKPGIMRTRKKLEEYFVARQHSSPSHKNIDAQLLPTQPYAEWLQDETALLRQPALSVGKPDKLPGNSNAYKQSKVIKAFKEGKLIAKMLENPKRFEIRKTGLRSGYDRVRLEVDELKHRKCIQVSSVSYMSPNVPTQLFRDIGFLLERDKCEVKAIYSKDVYTRLLDNQGEVCKWSINKHEFVKDELLKIIDKQYVGAEVVSLMLDTYFNFALQNIYSRLTGQDLRVSIPEKAFDLNFFLKNEQAKKAKYFELETSFGGYYRTVTGSHEFKKESISALQDSLDLKYNSEKCPLENELIISYSKKSIVGMVVNLSSYEKKYGKNTEAGLSSLIVNYISEDCKLFRNLVKKKLGLELDVFLYNSDTCELSVLEREVQSER
ncbi:hypothetical protein [Endozoicomonas sp. ALB032]|uniref:hypothetical protein n=1 Tax=Endozoicomonas sp. ALB032 TaxID=3403082 RepID=UPI003BB4DDC3